MTRWISLFISFYLTLAVVQIPFVQRLMPAEIKDLLAPDEYYYISVISPSESFDPASDYYSEHLQPMNREDVERSLNSITGLEKIDEDIYALPLGTSEASVNLYTGDSSSKITEIEFAIPVSRVDSAKDVVIAAAKVSTDIPGSRIFDFNQEQLYQPGEKEKIIEAVKNYQPQEERE